jgi:peptidyl-prolyl cis-trans isomerase C
MAFLKNLAVTCALAGAVACTDESQNAAPDSVDALGPGDVATVNGERIPESLLRLLALRSLQKNTEDMTDEERQQVMDQLINLKLLAEAGLARRLDQERTIAAELELLRLQTLANWAIRRHVEENPPAEFELRALYEERMQNLSGTEYNARHILVDSREEADHVIDLLDDGGDFAALAEEYSTGPTGPNGGQLDWFTPDRMVQPFADAVRAMEVGTYTSEPVQTQFGWHVILLQETREQQPPGLESMRTELTTLAERQKMQEYVDTLRDAATVEIRD